MRRLRSAPWRWRLGCCRPNQVQTHCCGKPRSHCTHDEPEGDVESGNMPNAGSGNAMSRVPVYFEQKQIISDLQDLDIDQLAHRVGEGARQCIPLQQRTASIHDMSVCENQSCSPDLISRDCTPTGHTFRALTNPSRHTSFRSRQESFRSGNYSRDLCTV